MSQYPLVECERCQRPFYQVRKRTRFCSLECGNSGRRKNETPYAASWEQIGAALGMSDKAVRGIYLRAMAKLRREVAR